MFSFSKPINSRGSDRVRPQTHLAWVMILILMSVPAGWAATRYEEAKSAYDNGKWDQAIALLRQEIDEQPGHTVARILLGKAYEAAEEWSEAEAVWEAVLSGSPNEEHQDVARQALIRLRRNEADIRDIAGVGTSREVDQYLERDSFQIPMPEIPWEDITPIENRTYDEYHRPPIHYPTEHFDTFACNEKLAKILGDRAEIYLDFMSKRLFGGRAWSFRMPIYCYANYQDYVSVGGAPPGTGGVTHGSLLGKSLKVMLFQYREIEEAGGGKREVLYKYAPLSILPHELTHVVINEFFGGQHIPQWLHEAVAGRMEQTRRHYLEAARLARAVVAGEHFRMRDLFEQQGYPSSRIGLFYEQSAIVVLFLFEAGPEAMYTFFSELAQQHTHDQALSAALGIPEEGAVETFEKMWVDWMKRRYITDLRPDPSEKSDPTDTKALDLPLFKPIVDEMGVVQAIPDGEWRDVATDSLANDFCGVGETLEDWKADGGRIHCQPKEKTPLGSYLGIKAYEKWPMTVRCKFQAGSAGSSNTTAGFALLGPDKEDRGIRVLALLEAGRQYDVIVVLGDELAMYLDGTCTGRYPVPTHKRLEANIDYPLAFVGYGPLEVSDVQVAYIKNLKAPPPVEAPADGQTGEQPPQGGAKGRGRR